MEEFPAVDLIMAMESAIRNNKLMETEAEQLRLKVSAVFTRVKAPPSNLTIQERKAPASLQIDITIQPANKGRCTVELNTADYHAKMNSLLSNMNT